jgi:hypothetical protein
MKKGLLYNGLTKERSWIIIFLGIFSILCGLIGLAYSYMPLLNIALILGILSLGYGSFYKGVIIDSEKKVVKYYFALAGFKIGKWQALPSGFKYIISKKNMIISSIELYSGSRTTKGIRFMVLLVNENPNLNIILFESPNEKAVVNKARELSQVFELEFKEANN